MKPEVRDYVFEMVSVDGLKKLVKWACRFGPPQCFESPFLVPTVATLASTREPLAIPEAHTREYVLHGRDFNRDVWVYHERYRGNEEARLYDKVLKLEADIRRLHDIIDRAETTLEEA